MAKVRVYELAKDMGVESKAILAKLQEMGEYVRSASSTVEAPVVRKLRETLAAPAPAAPAAAPKKVAKPAAAAPAAERVDGAARPAGVPVEAGQPVVEHANGTATTAAPAPAPAPAAPPTPTPSALPPPAPPVAAAPPAARVEPTPAPARPTDHGGAGHAGVSPATPTRPVPGPRPGPRPAQPGAPRPGHPGTTHPGAGGRPTRAVRPGAPRPGNNPFTSTTGMQGPRSGRPGVPTQRPAGGVPGAPRPNPAMMPQRPGVGRPTGRPGPGGRGPGGRGVGAPGRAGGRSGAPGRGGSGGPGLPSGPGGAPGGRGRGGRGSTQGAFGRAGGPARRGRKSRKARRQEFDNMQAPTIGGVRVRHGGGEVVRLPIGASLTDLAERIGADAASLVQVLFHLGEMVTATQSVPIDTLQLLGTELDYDIQVVSAEDEDRELLESFDLEFGEDEGTDADLVVRPPVVTVMGHVDHGKTKLLDAIRHTNVVSGEAGGITQHIGAYQVATEVDGTERKITFIDTPGHEAFTAMRARGAQATDIAVLVVAADDGVMPQTVEAIEHARAADVPIVVAVNKVDKPGADPSKPRGQLTEYGLVAEEYGGDTMFVDVSALARTGIEDLLEAIVLTADAALDLRANPDQDAQGLAIEAHLDRGRGPMATVLVQRGTLRVGDPLVVGPSYGRVRALLDDAGQPVDEAPPSFPVQVLGLTAVPGAGDNVLVVDDERVARQIAERRSARERNAELAQRRGRRSLEQFLAGTGAGEPQELRLILKGDVSGSVEALEDALVKIDVGEEVGLRVIRRGVGAITQDDVNLAVASDAVIIGYNVRPAGTARDIAEREGVDIRFYSIIYQAIDDVEAALQGMLKPEFEEVQLGTAEVRELFRSSKAGVIAGCMVTSGIIRRNAKARLVRDGVVVADNAGVASLRRYKDDATEVREGFECGLTLTNYHDVRVGDVVESFEVREKARA